MPKAVSHPTPRTLRTSEPLDEAASSTGAPTKNSNLSAAKKAKNDEFYTQWADIEREMNAYLEYDPEVFRGKTVLLPCDDPEWSNFTKFFALHFRDFGLKKLISTSYAPNSNAGRKAYQPTLFEQDSPAYDKKKSMERGRMFVLDETDVSADGIINIDDLQWFYLEGDGDFRSEEVIALRNEADIVITNPPFSLFREFVAWLIEGGLKFSVIGNGNAPTTKEIFPLIMDNKLWKGATANNTDMVFGVPKGTDIAEADRAKAERLGYPADESYDYTRLGNSCWFTNIDHGRRHEPLQLMTMEDNLKYSRHAEVKGSEYVRYDNFDAIEVPYTDAIPSDYAGVMGVPISYLDKYNPGQFEILGITKTWFGAAVKTYPQQTQVSASGERTKVSKLNDGAVIKVGAPIAGKTYYEVGDEKFVQTYPRVLIRKKAGA